MALGSPKGKEIKATLKARPDKSESIVSLLFNIYQVALLLTPYSH
jgi:hypothetical protein